MNIFFLFVNLYNISKAELCILKCEGDITTKKEKHFLKVQTYFTSVTLNVGQVIQIVTVGCRGLEDVADETSRP